MPRYMYHPDPPGAPIFPPPEPRLELREISDVELAFPALVSPDPAASPDVYWRERNPDKGYWSEDRHNPWVALANDLFNGRFAEGKDGLSLLPRADLSKEEVDKAWRWVSATLRSYELKHECKLAVVAWILESFFWGYYIGEPPEHLTPLQGEEE